MPSNADWLAPRTLDEALALRAENGDEAAVVGGGTFLAILLNQRLAAPARFLSLGDVEGLDRIDAEGDELALGAMVRHRTVERSAAIRRRWPAVADVFSVVATPRIRNQATVGGVLADADYASDPPSMLIALGARAVVSSVRGRREVAIADLIVGPYETTLEPDELLCEVRVPASPDRAVYRKFRTRSREDLPCVGVAAVRDGAELRVVVGAASGRPQHFPDLCRLGDPAEIGRAYAAEIDPVSDVRGSAAYRRRVIAVEVRRAVEAIGLPA